MNRTWSRKAVTAMGGFALLAGLAWAADRWSIDVSAGAYLFSYGFWLQTAVIALAAVVLVAATSRLWFSLWILATLLGVLYVVNYLSFRYLASPLTPADYFLVRDINVSSLLLFAHYVNAVGLLLGLAWFVAVCVLLVRTERPIWQRHYGLRALTCLLAAGVLFVGVHGTTGRRVFDKDRLQLDAFPVMSQFRAGLISHLVSSWGFMADAFDEPVDRHAVQKLITGLGTSPSSSAGSVVASAPDVVVIQSESFFDPDVIRQIGDTTGLLPNLHRAMKVGEGGSMIVPTFGGGTIRTEFEVLTGIPLAAYSKVQFPYLQLTETTIPGMARAFTRAGYQTTAVHGNDGGFWNRRRALRVLGFERFLTIGDFDKDAPHDGSFMSDRSMTDKIIEQLDSAKKSPQFIFAISIEAHGPFSDASVADQEELRGMVRPSSFSRDAADEYAHYAYHIGHADHELGRLWDYLQKRGRPYVLVFYGDHLPPFRRVYSESNFLNGLDAQQQEVPWIAVGSGVQQASEQVIYAWMLPGQVLQLAGVKPSNYMELTTHAGRSLLKGGTGADDRRAGLYSAARLDLQGKFDAFDEGVSFSEP